MERERDHEHDDQHVRSLLVTVFAVELFLHEIRVHDGERPEARRGHYQSGAERAVEAALEDDSRL